ncbi:hypothetical protein COW36_01960 [bacterium (Candidatus Blackallbacteria) CG17_big_fil_post_rev_8_21_14_2_50_48_46]|uniref:Methyltransferase domain-containing protein n=1 Tax=bacterium (Candidatus Blackallbacteria) CG17_big_fil_post_rev_8_21_14_2_50_48_46 TaxID=2014261 RepID=A0A2M7GAL6_9BACT|nr:MAG: hypothetical protein COW64_26350 [bacterium (Candidatus Blackallbacteria) CG18_big_fil_WC_8_21_14_2_50_49_26]PIW19199.1 MAG: hypothetical protein COW36_01960 [bacterium (Candidatus Blackallbacteria) CG17_big_fil_post_rev_8_21_14_2_50_48_46]PIW45451.1 MAG: hypothetical protein COW20_20180 [bacterium (Candidatus Blackallbacteria) CG13_big_fil_rev_8_21_14_2_50_49_14]
MKANSLSTRQLHLEDLLALLPWIPAGPVVDIGCGMGHFGAAMAAWGLPVTALDVDAEAIQSARKRYGEQALWLHEDIRSHRLNRESQAAIFCLNVFPYIPHGERARLIGRFKAAIKPGGLLVLSGFTEQDPSAEERWATSINRLDQRPTGVLQLGELYERMQGWDILFYFEGWVAEAHASEGVERHHISQIIARKPRSKSAAFDLKDLPVLGAGMLWKEETRDSLLIQKADYFELEFEYWLEPAEDQNLLRICHQHPCLIRVSGLGAPLQSAIPDLLRLLERCQSPWWVLPLALWSYQAGISLPLPPGQSVWEDVLQKILELRSCLPVPMVLENSLVSFSLGLAESELMTRLAESCDCGVSLDLGVLCESAVQQGFSPGEWLRPITAERVVSLKLPGSFSHPHYAEAWRLARQILAQTQIKALLIDADPLEQGLNTPLDQARRWLKESRS